MFISFIHVFDVQQVEVPSHLGINEVITAPQSLWQSPFVERLIGSIRRDCLDHVIVLNKKHLKRILSEYLSYYHNDRTHLGLSKYHLI